MIKSCISKKGFTLAEVLITLGIIGVVAAMTLPTLLTNTQKTTLAVATKRFHSIVSNAVQLYMADENTDDLRNSELCTAVTMAQNESEAQDATDNFVRKYFNVVEECDRNSENKCFAANYRNYKANGETYPSTWFFWKKAFILADGTALAIRNGDQGWPITVYVDVNGRKGPNIIGYDLWNMAIFYDGSVDESGVTPEARKAGKTSEYREKRFTHACLNTYGGCFGHFLNNGYKFDY